MITGRELLRLLDDRRIPYEITEHAPVFTIEEMLAAGLPYPEIVAKNLFVRDKKKRGYYLITVREDRRVDLKEFQARFGTRKLSFASEEDLMKLLGLKKGSVTPFGLLNDGERRTRFFLDADLDRLGIHPMENTATVWIAAEDLVRLLGEYGFETTRF